MTDGLRPEDSEDWAWIQGAASMLVAQGVGVLAGYLL